MLFFEKLKFPPSMQCYWSVGVRKCLFLTLNSKFESPPPKEKLENEPFFVILALLMPLMNTCLIRSMPKWPNIRSGPDSESIWHVVRLHFPFHDFSLTFPGYSRTPSVPNTAFYFSMNSTFSRFWELIPCDGM